MSHIGDVFVDEEGFTQLTKLNVADEFRIRGKEIEIYTPAEKDAVDSILNLTNTFYPIATGDGFIDSSIHETVTEVVIDTKILNIPDLIVDGVNVEFLTPDDALTLKYFKYNPSTNQLEATREIVTLLDSFKLGEQHIISSAGEIVSFENVSRKEVYIHASTGFKDQSQVENQGVDGLFPPHVKTFSDDLLSIETKGPVAPSGVTTYDEAVVTVANVAVFAQVVVVEEVISPDDYLFFTTYSGIDDTGIAVYQQALTNINLQIGDELDWEFLNPIVGDAGTQIYTTMKIAKGSQDAARNLLLVRASLFNPSTHWVLSKLRFFNEELLAFKSDLSGAIITTGNTAIQGYSFTNAFGQPLAFPSTLVTDNSGEIVTL